MVWTPGQVLQDGKYNIEKKLGQGGFGITYLAKDKKDNLFVIKTLKDTDKDSPDFDKCQQNFINEALWLKGWKLFFFVDKIVPKPTPTEFHDGCAIA